MVGNTLKGAWEAIPEDVKPYAAIELHPAKSVNQQVVFHEIRKN